MKKLLSPLLVVALFVAACSKDQKVVKQLDGSWKITEMTYDGTALDKSNYEGTTIAFEKCKQKKGNCTGTMSATYEVMGVSYSITNDFEYFISDKGEKITMITLKTTSGGVSYDCTGSECTDVATIIEHSKTKFVTESTDDDGKVTKTTMEKQ